MTTKDKPSDDSGCKLEELFANASSTTDLDHSIWLKDLRDKIYSMFRTPLKEEYSEEVFKWISSLCMCKSRFSWLCSDESKWTKEEAKIFSLIARLSINEIHILLPRIRQHLTSGEEIDYDDNGKVLARPADAADYSNFGVHLVIFEETIHSLVHGQDDDDDTNNADSCGAKLINSTPPTELKSLLERLKEITSELFDYLEDVHRYWTEIASDIKSRRFEAAQGALRAVSVWLSEDSGSFKSQCERYVIELIVRNILIFDQLEDHGTNIDLLVMALHSICSGDEDLKKVLKGIAESQVALQKYLDHVQHEFEKKKKDKIFKLKCGLIKDLL